MACAGFGTHMVKQEVNTHEEAFDEWLAPGLASAEEATLGREGVGTFPVEYLHASQHTIPGFNLPGLSSTNSPTFSSFIRADNEVIPTTLATCVPNINAHFSSAATSHSLGENQQREPGYQSAPQVQQESQLGQVPGTTISLGFQPLNNYGISLFSYCPSGFGASGVTGNLSNISAVSANSKDGELPPLNPNKRKRARSSSSGEIRVDHLTDFSFSQGNAQNPASPLMAYNWLPPTTSTQPRPVSSVSNSVPHLPLSNHMGIFNQYYNWSLLPAFSPLQSTLQPLKRLKNDFPVHPWVTSVQLPSKLRLNVQPSTSEATNVRGTPRVSTGFLSSYRPIFPKSDKPPDTSSTPCPPSSLPYINGKKLLQMVYKRSRTRKQRKITTSICNQCGAKFSSVGHLSRHLDSHGANRRYKCSVCNCAYSRKDNLQSHFKNAHVNKNNQSEDQQGDSDGQS